MTGLSDAERTRYHEDGFLCPVDVLSEEEAAAARARLEAAEARYGPMHYLVKPTLLLTLADELARHPRLLDVVESVIGPDILLWDSAFIIKEPGDRAHVTWHQDLTYWGIEPAEEVLSVWLALSPATPESGCMRMLPGSHKRGQLAHKQTFGEDNVLSRGQTVEAEIDPAAAVDTALKPGQMSLHHGFTFHASQPNRAAERRIGFNLNLVTPRVRQIAMADDSAMLLRGEDHGGHFQLEPRPSRDFHPALCAFQADVSRRRGKTVNYDPKGRLVNKVTDAAE